MNEDEKYKWLFLYISLTDKQREELHGSLPSTSCKIGAVSDEEAKKAQVNNDVSKENTQIRTERPLKRSRKELESDRSKNLESSSNENTRVLKKRNGRSEVKNEEKADCKGNTGNDNSQILEIKASENDENTQQHTSNSSDSSFNESDLKNENVEKESIQCHTQEITYPRILNWSKINEKVAQSNYDKFISSGNIVYVLKKLRSRFEVDYLYPIWNKAGVSMKLRLRVILASPTTDSGREEDDEYREDEDNEEDTSEELTSKFDLKSREPVKNDEYLHLRKELEVLDDPKKKEWISKLLNCRFLEVTFLIRDGGINSAYRAAIDMRNYFYSFMNRTLSKNNVIILTDRIVETCSFKYDQPRYFESKDEIHMTNTIRLLKLVNILQNKFQKDSIIARNKYRTVMLNTSYEDMPTEDPTKTPIRKVIVRSVRSIATGQNPKKNSKPNEKETSKKSSEKPQGKKRPRNAGSLKNGWDMERLRMCIIDPPPLPEYYTFSVKPEEKTKQNSSKTSKKNKELVNNSNKTNVDDHTSVSKKNVTNNTIETSGNMDTNIKDTHEGNNVSAIKSTTEDNTQIHTSTLNTRNKNMATTKHIDTKTNTDSNTNSNSKTNTDTDTNTSVTSRNKTTATTNKNSTHNKVTTKKINGVIKNELCDYKDFGEIEDNDKFDVVIIGAGVGGLGAANYLRQRNLKVGVIEARNRIGGRMLTTYFPKITVKHDHEDTEHTQCVVKNEGKSEVKKDTSRCHEDCVNLPEISIDLGPNYLHCNNILFSSSKAEGSRCSNGNRITSGGGISSGASPKGNGKDSNGVKKNGKEVADRGSHKHSSDKAEQYEKTMLFNPFKDVRNKRGLEKSILGLASMLKPLVGDISGFSNWEPTLYTNWYNEQTGKKINFLSVVKVNTVVDHMLQRTSKLFTKLTHQFFTDYAYTDKSIGNGCVIDNVCANNTGGLNDNVSVNNTGGLNNNEYHEDEGKGKPLVTSDGNCSGTTNTIDIVNDLTNFKKEMVNSLDLYEMTTTTTTMDDDHSHFNNCYTSSSCSASDAGNDISNDVIEGSKIGGTEFDVYNSVKVEDYENKAKKEDREYEHQQQHEQQKMVVDTDYSPEYKKVKTHHDSDVANTPNEIPQETTGIRKSTRIKKLSSFILYNVNLNKPLVEKNKKNVVQEFGNEESSRGKEKNIIWSKIRIKGMEELLKAGKDKLLSLWDIYIAIYVEILEEVKKELKRGLTETEERLLFTIMQSRLGYNSDMRETCISMCKLPASFSPLFLRFEQANEEEELEKAESSLSSGKVTASKSIDGCKTVGGMHSTTDSTTATIGTSEKNKDLDVKIFNINEMTLSSYAKYIRKQFDRYTKLSISRFDGKTDSDKLVINGWGWLLNHLIKNIKTNIYLNTKLLNLTILDVKKSSNSNTVKTDEKVSSESSNDKEDFGDYNIKLTVKYNSNSTTRFNKVNWDAHITNFTDYTLYNYGDDDDEIVDFNNNVAGKIAGTTGRNSTREIGKNLQRIGLNTGKNMDSKGKEDGKSSSNMSKILEGEKIRIKKQIERGKLEKYVEIVNLLQKHQQSDQQQHSNQQQHQQLDANKQHPDKQHKQGLGDVKIEEDEIKRIYSKYVLITVPNSLVGEIEFEPRLDENKMKSLKNYDMGYHNKIIMRFKPCDVFWPKQELQFNCLDSSFQFMNLDAYGKKGCLLAHSFPPFSKCFIKVTKEALLMRCLELLHKMFNLEKKVYPVQVFITNWKSDPFSRGSYSYPTKYARDEDIIHLKSPHPIGNPKVLFSGEYISNSYYQCVDGSYDTSIRAAEDIYNLALFNSKRSDNGNDTNTNNTSNSSDSNTNNNSTSNNTNNSSNSSNSNKNSPNSAPANSCKKKCVKNSKSSDCDSVLSKRVKYLDNILNNDHADSFLGIPIPLPSKDLLGYYLTDGSDELFSEDEDFITLPTNLVRNAHQSNDISKLNEEKTSLGTSKEPSLFDSDYEDYNDTRVESSINKKRKVLDENYASIKTSKNKDNTNTNTTNKDKTNSDTSNNHKTSGSTSKEQASDREGKELEMLLIIKSVFSEDEIHVGSLLESYGKFKEILSYFLQEQYINKHIHYSNVIMISLLTTTLQYIKSSHQKRREDDVKEGEEDEDEKYESEKDEKNGFDKLNKKVLSELSNHKDERVQIRNQQFSRKMIRNMSKLLGLRHDFLCYHCQRGGEVILCDTEGCDLVWHHDCLPRAFRPKTGINLNDVKPENNTPSRDESSTWKCPICLKFPIKRGEKSCSRDVQLYWIRRGFWWRVKATISVSLQIYKRIQYLSSQ